LISLSISLYLFNPVFAIVDRYTIAAHAMMAMPKAPMNENYLPSAVEDEIGTAR
jgi:uncharacterized protein YgbK (DUF1537 family)